MTLSTLLPNHELLAGADQGTIKAAFDRAAIPLLRQVGILCGEPYNYNYNYNTLRAAEDHGYKFDCVEEKSRMAFTGSTRLLLHADDLELITLDDDAKTIVSKEDLIKKLAGLNNTI